jgi:UDP-3-O-[3-hydroxymyristoyl] N-acetylglucosamine deacetylase
VNQTFCSKTIKNNLKFCGKGLHTGEYSEIILEPAKENSGINFFVNNQKIFCCIENVVGTKNCTVLGSGKTKIFTVEHLLSAIYGTEITDLNIYVSGIEIPALDGSAKEFVEGFYDVGLENLNCKKEKVVIDKEINFKLQNTEYKVSPNKNFCISCEVEYNIIGKQSLELEVSAESYKKEISLAKTFCFYSDIEKLQSLGLGKGGSWENVLIIGNNGVINKHQLSYETEFVRHKILDFLGDFSLLNRYLCGKIEIFYPNHYTNYEFVKYLKQKIF